MTEPTRHFVLQFNTDVGRVASFRIPRAIADKPRDNVEASMNAIMDNEAVAVGNSGVLTNIRGAQLVTTTRRVVTG